MPTPTGVTPGTARPPGKPWDVSEAAEYLRVSTRHLRRLIDAEQVRVIRIGRRVLLADAEVRRIAAEGC